MSTIGWDIGGVNTKVVRVAGDQVLSVRSRPFELQRDPGALVQVLGALPAAVRWIDARDADFPQTVPGNVDIVATDLPEAESCAAMARPTTPAPTMATSTSVTPTILF